MIISNMRKNIKTGFQRAIPTELPPVLVASMGRSGSTLVWDAIRQAYAREQFPKILKNLGERLISDQAWDLDDHTFNRGCVYKTHALGNELKANPELHVVFLFGSASDAALSVLLCQERYGDEWISEHFKHLRACGTIDQLGGSDILRFRDQLDSWSSSNSTPRILLKYEDLWDNTDKLSNFLGVDVKLPAKKSRTSRNNIEAKTLREFESTYSELDLYVSNMPSCIQIDC